MKVSLSLTHACKHSWNKHEKSNTLFRAAHVTGAFFRALFGRYKVTVHEVSPSLLKNPTGHDNKYPAKELEGRHISPPEKPVHASFYDNTQSDTPATPNRPPHDFDPITEHPLTPPRDEIPTPLPPESAEAPHLEIPTPSAPEPVAQPSPPDEPFPGLKPRDSLEKKPMEEVVQELHGNMTQLRRAKTNMVADTAPLDRIPESYLNTYKIATQSFFDCIHELAEPRLKRLIRNGRKTREPVDRQETVSEAMARLICAQPSGRYDQIDMGNQLFYRMPRLIGQSYEHLYGKMSEAGKKRFFSPGTEENALREQYNLFARTMVSIMLAGEKTEAIIRYDDNGARGDSDGNFGDKSFDERFVKHFDRPHESIDWSPSPTTWPT